MRQKRINSIPLKPNIAIGKINCKLLVSAKSTYQETKNKHLQKITKQKIRKRSQEYKKSKIYKENNRRLYKLNNSPKKTLS